MAQRIDPTDPNSSSELVTLALEQHRSALQHFLRRHVGGTQESQDLLQEVYLRVLSVKPQTLIKNPQAYLYGIAGNVVREFIRGKRRNPVNFDSDTIEVAIDQGRGLALTDGISLERQVQEILSQLPPTHLKVLIAERRDGMTVEQIAEKYGLSDHTVRKYIVQSLMRIREAWDRQDNQE